MHTDIKNDLWKTKVIFSPEILGIIPLIESIIAIP